MMNPNISQGMGLSAFVVTFLEAFVSLDFSVHDISSGYQVH